MTGFPYLLAFGFTHALMLGWLAAAAVPILIHLWNRQRYREVRWAAMEYLLAALRKNARRIRLEQWLLLALRTLLIVLIVLAVAQPYLEQAGLQFVAGQRTLKVLVVDGSYSMAYRPTDRSRFDRAKQLAAQIVEESSEGDGFALVLMASPPAVVVGGPALEKHGILDEIENLKLQHGGADVVATLAKVAETIRAAKDSRLTRTEIFFLTDLGRNSWAPDLGREALANYRRTLAELGELASLVVVDVGQAQSENLAVTSLKTSDPFALQGGNVTFEAQLQNFGSQAMNRQIVELFVDGRRVDEAHVDVPAGGRAAASFVYRFDVPGDHAIECRVPGDLLDVDNHRWLALKVRDQVRVLCVDGKPGGSGLAGATDFLLLALNPEASGRAPGAVRPEAINESLLVERDLASYDCVFLCNVGQFTASEARLLDAYLKRGGTIVFFLGDRVQASRYNRELGGEQGVRVLPALLGDVVSEAQYRFDPRDYRHPLVRPFKGREAAGLLTTPVYKYFQLRPVPNSNAVVALAFENRDPAIIEERLQRGRAIVVATDGSLSSVDPANNTAWSSFAVWPSYLPIVQEMLSLALATKASQQNFEVGQSLGEVLDPPASQSPLVLHTPTERPEKLRVTSSSEGSRWSYSDTSLSGTYRAEFGSPASTSQLYAVNVDTAESDLAKIDPDELPGQFTMHRRSNLDEHAEVRLTHRNWLHRALLYCVLGMLFCESFLAWRLGRRHA